MTKYFMILILVFQFIGVSYEINMNIALNTKPFISYVFNPYCQCLNLSLNFYSSWFYY